MKRIWIYDLEVYHQLFSATFIDKDSDESRVFFVHKDIDQRIELFEFLNNEVSGLIGYNCINYDSQIIEFLYRNPKATTIELRNYSDVIVNSENRRLDVPEYRLRIPHLDLYKVHHFDNKNRRVGLKWCEFMMDMDNIEDLPSDGIGDTWLDKVLQYNFHDVVATKLLYSRSIKLINLRKELKRMYGIDFSNASNSKIGSELCLKLYCDATGKYKNDVRSLRTYRSEINISEIIFDYIEFESFEFNSVLQKFRSLIVKNTKNAIEFSVKYKGFQFDYGSGGIHGSIQNSVVTADNEYIIIDSDVSSLYPSIAIANKLYPEHLGEEFYNIYNEKIVSVRLAEKAKGELGNKTIVEGYKEASNSVYGKSNDLFSWLYDPKYTMQTTINGQLMLSMLAESIMNIESTQLIQINTDGLTTRLRKDKLEEYLSKCQEWELKTKLTLEHAYYKQMVIKDCNNYIAEYTNNKTKCKGSFEFENIPLHKNKSHSIIPRAIYNYFIHDIPVEDTILNHRNIFDFCAGVRAKKSDIKGASHYELQWIDEDKLASQKLSKTVRYYISKKGKYLFKCYEDGSKAHVEAPLNLGKMKKDWKVTYFNKAVKYDNFDDYNLDYSYYIFHSKKQITDIINKEQLKLF